jgi:hypothetical protein
MALHIHILRKHNPAYRVALAMNAWSCSPYFALSVHVLDSLCFLLLLGCFHAGLSEA